MNKIINIELVDQTLITAVFEAEAPVSSSLWCALSHILVIKWPRTSRVVDV